MSFKIKYLMNAVFIKGKQKLKQHSMMKYSLHYETWSFRKIYPLFFKIYIFELVIISAIPLVVEKWSNFSVGPGSFELYSIHIFSAFFLCAEIYATSHIIILVKAFPTRLPYQDIENRTYLYVLYEYLSASLPTLKHYTLGKIIHLHMHWKPTFAERVSFRRTSLVSSNEIRFIKRVSFWLVSILEQTNLVENHLSSDSLIVTIKNQVVSQKPWVILDVQQLSPWNFLLKKIGGKWLLPTSNLDNPQFVIGCNTE